MVDRHCKRTGRLRRVFREVMLANCGTEALPTSSKSFYDTICGTRASTSIRALSLSTCPSPLNMDEIQWDAVQNGDLESLGVVLLSSSTSRRVRALQEIREKNGTALPHPLAWDSELTLCLHRDDTVAENTETSVRPSFPDLSFLH
jgi:hypothetical protein